MAKIIEEEGRFADPNDISFKVREYLQVKKTAEEMEARQKELRDELISSIDELGYEDGDGNYQLELDNEIFGIVRLEKQRRVKRTLDEDKAEAIIEANELGDEVYKMVRTIDEDALMAAHYEGKISEYELDEMFPAKITWALMTKKS